MSGSVGVAVCRRVNILGLFAPALEELTPHRLRAPEDVAAPHEIEFALSFFPADNAFQGYPNLKLVASIGAGADGILTCPSLPPDVPVIRVQDADQAAQMAGFALFHVVYWHRRFDQLLAAQSAGRWMRAPGGRSPAEKTVGVLGLGYIGRRVAQGFADLGYSVRALSKEPPPADLMGVTHFAADALPAFLAECDYVVGLLPETAQTHGMLNAQFFRQMKPGSVLVQLGRGGQVVESDLIAALDSGHLLGASLDVFAREPLPPDDPLWRHPKVVATPHTAAEAGPVVVARMIERALAAIARGETPSGTVSRADGY